MQRRALLAWFACVAGPARAATPRAPVLLLRHAITEPGVGDPPGYRLDQCSTQRNLSAQGREQARAIGARLASLGLRPEAIRSSRWCRCLDTGAEIVRGLGGAALAVQPWPALDSFFDAREREPAQSAQLRTRLRALRGAGFELWVTHQVNISALVGASTAMGQALWVAPGADGGVVHQPFE